MIEIPLSKKGKHAGKYVAIVDDEDKDLAELNWRVLDSRGVNYYAMRSEKGESIRLHRVIVEKMLGRALTIDEHVDHINRNGLDNRRKNLRVATRSQNAANRVQQKNNTSGYKGVSYYKQYQKYRAKIRFHQRSITIGYFETAEEAHEAYCKKAKELFGDFANFGNNK